MRFCSLFSSSSGNSIFIGSAKTGILVDAGVSAKRLKEALLQREIDPSKLGGIFITHEHSDHINGMRILASTYKIPVYATEGTMSFLEKNGHVTGKFPYEIIDEKGVEIGDIFIRSFKTPHDSLESCGYQITFESGEKAAIATDTGCVTEIMRENIKGCSLVMLESNHDEGMLQNGPYPYYLKRRILSDNGHLSNIACAEFVKELVSKGTSRVFLGHLSDENNFPDLAYQTSLSATSEIGAVNGRDFILEVNKKENDGGIVRF
ncbi:MAG: MBL fold metallo-hydrolase [Acutalibacteraceae bacterium]